MVILLTNILKGDRGSGYEIPVTRWLRRSGSVLKYQVRVSKPLHADHSRSAPLLFCRSAGGDALPFGECRLAMFRPVSGGIPALCLPVMPPFVKDKLFLKKNLAFARIII